MNFHEPLANTSVQGKPHYAAETWWDDVFYGLWCVAALYA